MAVNVARVSLRRILSLRELYRKEMDCQIVHDSWHGRGFTQSWLITDDGRIAGYGSIGGAGREPRDVVKEFFLHASDRNRADVLFRQFVVASGARRIEAQTNDRLLTQLLLDSVERVERDRVLFADGHCTNHAFPDATFRPITRRERSRVFQHEVEPVGDWVIEIQGEVVATGGLMFHYNPPYSDIYMEVAAPWRRRGIGAFLVQQLKRVSHEMQKVPAARCAAANIASRRTLEKAGMIACGWIINGTLRQSGNPHSQIT